MSGEVANQSASATVRVFVNERGVDVAADGTVADAIHAFDGAQGDALIRGEIRLTDSRGLPQDTAARVHGGMILRTLPVRSTPTET